MPDVSSPVFREAARAQSRLVAASAGTADAQALIDAIGVGGPVD